MVANHNYLRLPKQLKNLANPRVYSQSMLLFYSGPNSLRFPIFNPFMRTFRSSLSSLNNAAPKKDPSHRPRILYVDDESRICQVIKYGLEKYGFAVDIYSNPKSALSSFKPGIYDMLLIDVRLPDIDGLDLCNELLKIDDKVKVCFITAYELSEEEVRRRASGLKTGCIIKKPVTFDALVDKINTQIQRDN